MSNRHVNQPWLDIALDKDRDAEAAAAMRRLNEESHEDPEADPSAVRAHPKRTGWRGLLDRFTGPRG